MKPHPFQHGRSRHCRVPGPGGFTLIELLVVVAIISTLLAIGANYMKQPDDGHRLSGAVGGSAAVFQSARGVAMTRNASVRVLVNNDPTDTENYRRQIVTLYSTLDENGLEAWKLEDKPLVFPRGIYFDSAHSDDDDGDKPPTLRMEKGTWKFGAGPEWFCYSFAANGASQEPGMRFVVAVGILDPKAGVITYPNEKAASGFVLRRAGHVTMFRDPSQILD